MKTGDRCPCRGCSSASLASGRARREPAQGSPVLLRRSCPKFLSTPLSFLGMAEILSGTWSAASSHPAQPMEENSQVNSPLLQHPPEVLFLFLTHHTSPATFAAWGNHRVAMAGSAGSSFSSYYSCCSLTGLPWGATLT